MKKFIIINTIIKGNFFYIIECLDLSSAAIDLATKYPDMVPGVNIIEIDDNSKINLGERIRVTGKPNGDMAMYPIDWTAELMLKMKSKEVD